jgi:hypothetical protein
MALWQVKQTMRVFLRILAMKCAHAGCGRPPLCQDQVRHQGQQLLVELEG